MPGLKVDEGHLSAWPIARISQICKTLSHWGKQPKARALSKCSVPKVYPDSTALQLTRACLQGGKGDQGRRLLKA